jgi:hypothetical protein
MASTYSQAIFEGLQSRGFSTAEVRRAIGASATIVAAISAGKRELTDAQIQRIEALAGKTGGQLAASVLEPTSGSLSSLMDGWAQVKKVEPVKNPKSITPKRRAAAVSR